MKTYYTVDEIKEHNRQLGQHFFSEGANNFFNSRTLEEIWNGNVFITSEKYSYDTPRYYTVRIALNGEIDTIGDFNSLSNYMAEKLAKSLPKHLAEAIKTLKEAWNAGDFNGFMSHIIGDQDQDTFCGACQFLYDNAKDLQFNHIMDWFKTHDLNKEEA